MTIFFCTNGQFIALHAFEGIQAIPFLRVRINQKDIISVFFNHKPLP